jgi:predicted Kef-type K+ transport protein
MTDVDPLWLPVAFALGLVARVVGLPPLVGFLAGGFVLHAWGYEGGDFLDPLADIGVTLLLFTIGLKLRVSSLTRPEVWAGTTLQMGLTMVLFAGLFAGFGALGLAKFADLKAPQVWLLAFGLGFSSTVFAVKILEERGEVDSRHGNTAIGMLIMQDVIAVVFLAASMGKLPSPWAVGLLGLLLLRPLLGFLLERAGHGELLILLGFLFALGLGHAGFEALGVKGDLGALLVGMLLAPHPKAKELAATLMSFKDLLLVGFFLSIGLKGFPDATGLGIAVLLVLLVPFKVLVYFGLLTRFRLRSRTSFLSSVTLANFSEFGLIVGALAAKNGWLPDEWLVISAIALSISLVAAAPANTHAHALYERMAHWLRRFETRSRLPGDEAPDIAGAEVAVFGMGRVGTSAYDVLKERFGDVVVGFDSCERVVADQLGQGRNVHLGDPTDADFWERVAEGRADRSGAVRLVLLAMGEHLANVEAAERIRHHDEGIFLAATARYADQVGELQAKGVTVSCNLLTQAGTGFAEHVYERLEAARA